MKTLIAWIVVVNLACTYTTRAADYKGSGVDRVYRHQLDQRILTLLEADITEEAFLEHIVMFGQADGSNYDTYDGRRIFKVYTDYKNFFNECNSDLLESMSYTRQKATRNKNINSKLIIYYLLQQRSPEEYAQQCIEEFDGLAVHLYGNDPQACELMSTLASHLFSRYMSYRDIQSKMNPYSVNNYYVYQLTLRDWTYVCNYTNLNVQVQRMVEMMSKLLGIPAVFRRPSIIDKLNQQKYESAPNSIKLLCLALFCRIVAPTNFPIQVS